MAGGYSSSQAGEVDGKGPTLSATTMAIAGIIVAGLYFGREVLIPFVMAVLLSFVLAIPVRGLQRLGLGRSLPVAIVVICTFIGLGALLTLLTLQAADLAGELPRYQWTIREKVTSLRDAVAGSGLLERFFDMAKGLSDELANKPSSGSYNPAEATPTKPLPVEVVSGTGGPFGTITALISPALHPLAVVGLTTVFTVFMLLQRSDLRNRAIRLAGSHDLQRTTAAMNDAATRLSRFFLVQVLLNGGFGLLVGVGLWLIGVPSPILWGILAAISRFIPYVGVAIAAGGPLLLSAAVDPGWTMLAITAAFFAVSEFLLGQVVEPLVYGHSTGLSPIAVIASVTFWTWVWGPVGLLLATPLTVCLVVLGRHVDQLAFLDVMLGDRPPLTMAEHFYQRVLAGDSGEVVEQAEEFLAHHSLATYYDEVAVKGLALAHSDRTRDALDERALRRITETMSVLVEDLRERDDADADQATTPADAKVAVTKRAAGDEGLDEWLEEADRRAAELPVLPRDGTAPPRPSVLCLAGRTELDLIGASLLAHILSVHGVEATTEAAQSVADKDVIHLPDPRVAIVCLSYLDVSSPVHVRYSVRRVRKRFPHAKIIVGAWGLNAEQTGTFCDATRTDFCSSRLTDAAATCLDLLLNPEGESGAVALDNTGQPEGPSPAVTAAS